MRGLTMPPETEDYSADPVELFFDLAFVFAFSQIVGVLVHHPDWTHVGEVGLLFGLLWLPWQQFTWSANAVPGNSRPVRALILLATAVSVPMAASVSSALDGGGWVFAACITAIFGLGAGLMLLAAESGSAVSASARRWFATNAVALAVLLVGAAFDDGARIALWTASLVIVVYAMYAAGSGEWLLRPGHMAERLGLIIIIALGEVIVAIGIPVVAALEGDGGIPATTVAVLAASGAFAGLTWWSYFDRPGPALEHRAGSQDSTNALGRYVRDIYTWFHGLIVAGIILSAAAIEEAALHPDDPLEPAFRVMLAGGMTLTFLGVVLSVRRAFDVVARERVAAAAVAAGSILALGSTASGLVLVVLVDVVLLVMLVAENQRIEH